MVKPSYSHVFIVIHKKSLIIADTFCFPAPVKYVYKSHQISLAMYIYLNILQINYIINLGIDIILRDQMNFISTIS